MRRMALFCPMLTKCFRSLDKAPNAVTLIPAHDSTFANTRADGVGSGQQTPTIVGWALSAGSNQVLPAPDNSWVMHAADAQQLAPAAASKASKN